MIKNKFRLGFSAVFIAFALPLYAGAITESELTIPFYTRPESQFIISKTYYVAANEPGASNANNGLYPTYQGGLNGPFKDLNDYAIRNLLSGSQGVKMVLRQGTYILQEMNEGGVDSPTGGTGLSLNGTGDEFHPVILTSYLGETAILDGGENLPWDQIRRVVAGQETYNIKIRQVINLGGQYNIIENLTIRYGFRHNIMAGGKYSIIRNSILIGAYEDSIKTLVGADWGSVYNNNIYGFSSQAVDHYGAQNWIFKNNDIHDPGLDPVTNQIEGNAFGGKGGVNNTVIVGNKIHDFNTNFVQAISFGGAGSTNLTRRDSFGNILPASSNELVTGNTIYNYRGSVAGFMSCQNCTFENNTIYNSVGLASLGLPDEQYADPDVGSYPRSQNISIRNNRFAGNQAPCSSRVTTSISDTCYIYYIPTLKETSGGFVSSGNTYYADTLPGFTYIKDGIVGTFTRSQFKTNFQTDTTSTVRPRAEFSITATPTPTPTLTSTPTPNPTDITPPYISYVTITGITPFAATVNWTTNEPADGQIAFCTTYLPGCANNTPLVSQLTTSHTINLSGLTPSTYYYAWIKSRDAAGNLRTYYRSFRTGSTATSPAPTPTTTFTPTPTPDYTAPYISSVTITGITPFAASINWTTNEPANGQIAFCTTYLPGCANNTPLVSQLTTSHTINLSGLTPSTYYYAWIKSRDAAGNLRTYYRSFRTGSGL